MPEVVIVETVDEILVNVKYLEQIRKNPNHEHYEAYCKLVRKGSNFFPYMTSDGLAFVPSRFTGYKNNTIEINAKDPGHGGETDRAISAVVGHDRKENEAIDVEYKKFCKLLNIEPYNKKRKFWNYKEFSGEHKETLDTSSNHENYENTKNLIFYGPPGTGKTHKTAFEAVRLCVDVQKLELDEDDRPAVMKKYEELCEQGRIEFVTFHQSFTYQEFVEGLRPVTDSENNNNGAPSGGFSLKPHSGIFKLICERANRNLLGNWFDSNRDIYQVAVNHTWVTKNYINKCLDESKIFISWSKDVDWSKINCTSKKDFDKEWKRGKHEDLNNTGGRDQTYHFYKKAEIGDYVILADGKKNFVAIGIISGPYSYNKEEPEIPHFRIVNWIWTDERGKSHKEFYPVEFTNHSFYPLVSEKIDWNGLEQLVAEQEDSEGKIWHRRVDSTQPLRGRFAGRLLKPLINYNPRKKGSHGYRSFDILLNNRDGGIIYEKFLEKGGLWKDLDWDFKRGRVSVEDVPITGNIDNPVSNFVLIIDEINRANISKVFGELITLLEENKRIGMPNQLKVRLPYSGEVFGVPKNLYIIGTMNTADRSIALLDTALRRRFRFIELMPDPDIEDFPDIDIGNGKLSELLKKINERIEYLYNREHQIGHAYFIDCKSPEDVARVFRYDIIPLLEEYFFEDRGKIAKVLEFPEGESSSKNGKYSGCFFDAKEINPKMSNIEGYDSDAEPKWRWTVRRTFDFSKLDLS